MVTRNKILGKACEDCMKELYSLVQPKVTWDEFVAENKEYSKKYSEWEHNRDKHPEWEGKKINECIGLAPYEFYYLPKDVMKEVCDNYIYAYRLDHQQEFLDSIAVLKGYCEEPILDKYIEERTDEYGNYHPGYRGYEHPDNLEKELYKLLRDKAGFSVTNGAIENLSKEVQNKFFEFLDMAGNFFSYNRDLNSFNMTVYLGASPHSNKEKVIENWKKYRGKDIEIDESVWKEEFYDEED